MIEQSRYIIFFDGTCMLCNRFIQFVLKKDRQDHFFIATLDSEAAKKYLTKLQIDPSLNQTVYLYQREDQIWKKSEAALKVLSVIYPSPLIKPLYWIPTGWRDQIYDWIANNRYRWFGRTQACEIIDPKYYKDKLLM